MTRYLLLATGRIDAARWMADHRIPTDEVRVLLPSQLRYIRTWHRFHRMELHITPNLMLLQIRVPLEQAVRACLALSEPCPGKELVGPLPTIRFSGGPRRHWSDRPRQAYTVPANTCDPRHQRCTDHHPACDCREALLAESLNEYRQELRTLCDALDYELQGHQTWPIEDRELRVVCWDGDRPVLEYLPITRPACQCKGCQIARAAGYYPRWQP